MSNLSSSSTTTGKGDSRVSYNASYDQLTYKSRVISSVLGDTERHRFLVGTHSLTSKNEIHLIEYLEDKKSIVAAKIFKHQNEIWSISPHPKNPDLFWTVYNTGKNFKTSLWKNSYSDGKSHELSEVVSIDGLADPIQNVLWYPDPESFVEDKVILVDSGSIQEYKIDGTSATGLSKYQFERKVRDAKWDPNHPTIVRVASGKNVETVDLRAKKVETTIKFAHENYVTCMDIDAFPTYQLATGGDDAKIKIWDVRKGSAPIKVFHSHSHWITSVKYNPVHDELILSASSDFLVNLWYVPTICFKEKNKDLDSEELQKDSVPRKDVLIQSFDDHEESVYSVAWSNSASWVFASVSYDGRVLVHTVPHKTVSEINIS